MRIYFKTTGTKELVPFNYQEYIVRCIHKWIGENDIHDSISNYSFSLLNNGEATKNGLMFKKGSSWFFSAWDNLIIKKIIDGVRTDPAFIYGMDISEVIISEDPNFNKINTFFLGSPVLIKRNIDNNVKFYYYDDRESPELLMETINNKIQKAGLKKDESLNIYFDDKYKNPKIKMLNYKGINNKASFCPVIIEAKPETKAFIWNVGLGNSTGIGFGSIK